MAFELMKGTACTATSVPANNYAMYVAQSQGTGGDATTAISLPGATGSTGMYAWDCNGTATTPFTAGTAARKRGWIATVKGDASKLDTLDSIASANWSITVGWFLSLAWTGSFQIFFRAYQTNAAMSTMTAITLPGADANGYVYTATITPGAGTSGLGTISLTSVGAVTFAGTTPFFYVEIGLKVTALGVTSVTANPGATVAGNLAVATGGVSRTRSPAESLSTPSDAPARQFIGGRSVAESVPSPSDSPARRFTGGRNPTESLSTPADTPARQFVGGRNPQETLSTPVDTPNRQFIGGRAVAESVPVVSDSTARTLNAIRSISETVPVPGDAVSRFYQAKRFPNETLSTPADTIARRFIGKRNPTETLSTPVDTVARLQNSRRFVYESTGGATDYFGVYPNAAALAGVVKDTLGSPVSGATVMLFRQIDNFFVTSMTSDGSGNYNFSRYSDDPYTYYVVAFRADTPEIHGVTDRNRTPV